MIQLGWMGIWAQVLPHFMVVHATKTQDLF